MSLNIITVRWKLYILYHDHQLNHNVHSYLYLSSYFPDQSSRQLSFQGATWEQSSTRETKTKVWDMSTLMISALLLCCQSLTI